MQTRLNNYISNMKSKSFKKNAHISIYLDTRKAKANNKFPLKLRVFTSAPRKQKMYSTIFEFEEKVFDKVWNSEKPRGEYKELRKQITKLITKAEETAEEMHDFSFELFENKLYRTKGDGTRLQYYYANTIQDLTKRGRIGTSSSYELSRKSLIDFVKTKKKSEKFENLTFYHVTKKWLQDYEDYMIIDKERSNTTVGIYLRNLRALFNKAIEDKEINKEIYPFGKKKYIIPTSQSKKKALSKTQLKELYQCEPETPEQQKAKDFWFFSYACNGMNIKDIALLKFKDIKDGKFDFIRSKTEFTSKANIKFVTVYLNDFSSSIIEKYSIDSGKPNDLVFDIISKPKDKVNSQKEIKNFTRLINQHLKKLCKANGLPEDISTYWARHSFATNSIRNGASMEFIQESLGHGNLATTKSYFHGFEDETKKEFAEQLMNFD